VGHKTLRRNRTSTNQNHSVFPCCYTGICWCLFHKRVHSFLPPGRDFRFAPTYQTDSSAAPERLVQPHYCFLLQHVCFLNGPSGCIHNPTYCRFLQPCRALQRILKNVSKSPELTGFSYHSLNTSKYSLICPFFLFDIVIITFTKISFW
jgi:hypothetical protein